MTDFKGNQLEIMRVAPAIREIVQLYIDGMVTKAKALEVAETLIYDSSLRAKFIAHLNTLTISTDNINEI